MLWKRIKKFVWGSVCEGGGGGCMTAILEHKLVEEKKSL